MKKSILISILVLIPSLLMAQVAGGVIHRPSNKQSVKMTNPSSKNNNKNQSQRNKQIIQRLVNNMILVEGGSFMMGKTKEQDSHVIEDRTPIHQVSLSSFYIAKYEITQEEWQAVMGSNPSTHKGDRMPVENVNWYDCQLFINKLNKLTGKKFRLPTEAEWEYAARGGIKSKGTKYAGSNNASDVSWNCNNCKGTNTVGQKIPNELGLYDMSGNVWEWCNDWYGEYIEEHQTNPQGPESGTDKVCRGGCWLYGDFQCLVSCRSRYYPNNPGYSHLGLRLAL